MQARYDLLRDEARSYSPDLAAKPHFVVFTKSDLLPDDAPLPTIIAPEAEEAIVISAVANRNLDRLKQGLWRLLGRATTPAADEEAFPWN